jgi:hypothetical protein
MFGRRVRGHACPLASIWGVECDRRVLYHERRRDGINTTITSAGRVVGNRAVGNDVGRG